MLSMGWAGRFLGCAWNEPGYGRVLAWSRLGMALGGHKLDCELSGLLMVWTGHGLGWA